MAHRAMVALLALWLAATGALAEPTRFVRLARDANHRPISLQVASTRYAGKGFTVDLIAAVHVGEKSYYHMLNQAFKGYDAVLFELIADEEQTREVGKGHVDSGDGSDNPLSSVQLGLKNLLGLEFQLEQIDYSAPNFVHADLSPEEFAASWQKHHESMQAIMTRLIKLGADQPTEVADSRAIGQLDVMSIMVKGPDQRERNLLRQVLAAGFQDLARFNEAMEGAGGSTLISVRNQKALQVLAEQVKAGRKHLAIYYGAAHMPLMEKQLQERFQVVRQSQRWLVAWDLRPVAPAAGGGAP